MAKKKKSVTYCSECVHRKGDICYRGTIPAKIAKDDWCCLGEKEDSQKANEKKK